MQRSKRKARIARDCGTDRFRQPLAEELREAWHICLRTEVHRAKASPSRRDHNPFVAQAALDVAYRRQLVGFALRG